jgi:quinol-cytochrome oxidoreductase complex cytochrome b subunit
MLLPFFIKKKISSSYRLSRQLLFWRFITICTLLTWLGACRIEYPYISLRQAIRITYFMYFVIGFLLNKLRKLLGSYPKYK